MLHFITHQFRFDRQYLFADIRNDFLAAIGEFMGTVLFLLPGLGGISAAAMSSKSNTTPARSGQESTSEIKLVASPEQLIYISASMALSLLFSAWIFYRSTGAAFNPNVSFALWLIGAIKPVRFVLYCIAQFLGATVAAALLQGLLPDQLAVTPTLGVGTSESQGVFIEMFGTTALILCVMFVAVEKHRSTFLAPVCIGLSLFAVHLWAVVYTGAAVNTARAFGPAVVTGFGSEHWIYWIGPTLGSLVATVIYVFLKSVKYWQLNPGQDVAETDKSPQLFVEDGAYREFERKGSGDAVDARLNQAEAGIDRTAGDRRSRGDNAV